MIKPTLQGPPLYSYFRKRDVLHHLGGNMVRRLWLASASERRRSMLLERFENIEVIAKPLAGFNEPKLSSIPVKEQVRRVCMSKLLAALERWPENANSQVVMVSDTLVADPEDINVSLGQPIDEVSALSMLSHLSGRIHSVWTATALLVDAKLKLDFIKDIENEILLSDGKKAWLWVQRALVEIEELDAHALDDLIHSKSWLGKAGGYDLAGPMAEYAHLVEGGEEVVLGISTTSMEALQAIIGANPNE